MRFLVLVYILAQAYVAYPQTPITPAKTEKSTSYRYLLYTPGNYNENKDKPWPLIIYLHGKSACGNNLDKVRRYGLPFFLDREMKVDAIIAAPQCPSGKNWVSDNWFIPFLNDIKKKYHIDENRIYLTGMSLGGFGTFSLAIKYPDIFAAVSPFCGGGQPITACPMKDIPTWVFHGDKDEQVPLHRSQEMVDALVKCGGNPKFSILKGMPHDIHRYYNNPELYQWMLSQSKDKKIPEIVNTGENNTDTITKTPLPIKQKPLRLFKKKDKSTGKKKTGETTEESDKIKVRFE